MNSMSKTNMYNDLVKCEVFGRKNIEETKVFENDIIIEDENININRKYKIETDNMTNEEVIISLLAKQTLQLKSLCRILSVLLFLSIVLGIIGALSII